MLQIKVLIVSLDAESVMNQSNTKEGEVKSIKGKTDLLLVTFKKDAVSIIVRGIQDFLSVQKTIVILRQKGASLRKSMFC